MSVSCRHQVVSQLVLPYAVHVEPVERVFMIAGLPEKVIGIVDVDMLRCAPLEDHVSGVD